MLSHFGVGSRDLKRSEAFYDAVLASLGLRQRTVEPDGSAPSLCWVHPDRPLPRFYVYTPFNGDPATAGNGVMIAFIAPSIDAVDAAHKAGLEHGGSDAGAPGLRPHYAPDYYGAYLIDPDENKIHIVHREELVRELEKTARL
ncbi:VOC family protein [Celeribacter arenosi]|uniref:VOC family protein n=1 Tax=Celeribacter arenosi TaxID=792649 RepID=A0ABP7KED2_9RHOB